MIFGLPVTSGAVQLTFTLLGDAPVTVGCAGAPGQLPATPRSAKLCTSLPAASRSVLSVPEAGTV